jgi:hypothetical protein
MARRLQSFELPGWPARMGVMLAAAYLGISPSKLLAGSKGKKPVYPQPVYDGRLALWRKSDLDAFLGDAPNGEGKGWLGRFDDGPDDEGPRRQPRA